MIRRSAGLVTRQLRATNIGVCPAPALMLSGFVTPACLRSFRFPVIIVAAVITVIEKVIIDVSHSPRSPCDHAAIIQRDFDVHQLVLQPHHHHIL